MSRGNSPLVRFVLTVAGVAVGTAILGGVIRSEQASLAARDPGLGGDIGEAGAGTAGLGGTDAGAWAGAVPGGGDGPALAPRLDFYWDDDWDDDDDDEHHEDDDWDDEEDEYEHEHERRGRRAIPGRAVPGQAAPGYLRPPSAGQPLPPLRSRRS
ncbi:MAG: hypothetical protein DIU70_004295 [Bacillota bacterium]|nr:MAG: hypothetical protein DIU70_05050 [Bacillota bacterium]